MDGLLKNVDEMRSSAIERMKNNCLAQVEKLENSSVFELDWVAPPISPW